MPASPSLSIWRHQWLRAIRFGSVVDILLAILAKGGVLIGTMLIGVVFLVLVPAAGGPMVGTEAVSAMLAEYLLPITAVAWIISVWLDAGRSCALWMYRFYPVSLTKIALTVQAIRLVRIRYIIIFVVASIFIDFLSYEYKLTSISIIVLIISWWDSLSIVFYSSYDSNLWTLHSALIIILSVSLLDVLGGSVLSKYLFEEWMKEGESAFYSLFILLGIACAAATAAHRKLITRLRFGS